MTIPGQPSRIDLPLTGAVEAIESWIAFRPHKILRVTTDTARKNVDADPDLQAISAPSAKRKPSASDFKETLRLLYLRYLPFSFLYFVNVVHNG